MRGTTHAVCFAFFIRASALEFDSIALLPGGRIEREQNHGDLCSTGNSILQVESSWLPKLKQELSDVSALIDSSTTNALAAELLDETILDGHLLAIPTSVDFNVIFFRRGELNAVVHNTPLLVAHPFHPC
jgi:hypothetical protein